MGNGKKILLGQNQFSSKAGYELLINATKTLILWDRLLVFWGCAEPLGEHRVFKFHWKR